MESNTGDGPSDVPREHGTHDIGIWFRVFLAVLRRPGLWATALRQIGRVARPGWWRRPPFVPVPDRAYLRFRLETAYGLEGDPRPEDVVDYLQWVRAGQTTRNRDASR